MNKPLKKFAAYSGERISLDEIDVETYITTDNLLQNKKGKVAAEKLPKQVAGNVTRFEKGDILIANIRPYLKKIWLANYTGGSSADVLTLKVEDRFDSSFVYYALFRDEFFEHMMNGSKGTKMPRGDKNQILDFPIPNFNIQTQANISKVLSTLDAKIELNNKINGELDAMAKLIYDYWFVQFDFPDDKGNPYKSSGGKMVYSKELKREIPEGWEVGVLSDIANITMGQSPDGSSFNEENNGTVFYQGSTDFGWRYPTIRQYTAKPSRMAQENDILLSVRAPVGALNQAMENCCIGRGLSALREKVGSNSYLWGQMEYFKQVFDRRNNSGTTFGSMTKGDLFGLKIHIPPKEIVISFKSLVDFFHKKIKVNSEENQKLSELRDWLLPMLMNGQVTVSNPYEQEEENLGMAAEPGAVYQNDKEAIDALFETINHDYETAVIQLLTERRFGFTYGKKYTHKMFSNIEMLNSMPKFKELAFEEKGWGMFSKAIAKTIDIQKFIYFHRLDFGAEVLKVRPNAYKDVVAWMLKDENKPFVADVENMLTTYEKPIINKDMDRIELFNTVLECMKVLETDNLQAIRAKMTNWKMKEEYFKTKAEKFSENETLHMIQFVKEVII